MKSAKSKIVCVDFDGTCVSHEYPEIGKEIGATEVLQELVDAGHKIILYTMRSGDLLQEAIGWFDERKIPLFGVNKNPTQWTWTKSPKPYAHIYIDDIALGIPLVSDDPESDRPYVDWTEARHLLVSSGFLK